MQEDEKQIYIKYKNCRLGLKFAYTFISCLLIATIASYLVIAAKIIYELVINQSSFYFHQSSSNFNSGIEVVELFSATFMLLIGIVLFLLVIWLVTRRILITYEEKFNLKNYSNSSGQIEKNTIYSKKVHKFFKI